MEDNNENDFEDNFSEDDSFDESDSFDDSNEFNENQERKKIFKLVVIVVVAFVVGISVYFVTDMLMNRKNKDDGIPKDVVMELNDEMVKYLYDGVTYDADGLSVRCGTFLKGKKVTVDDFSNQDKIYLALRYSSLEDYVPVKKETPDEDSEKLDDLHDRETPSGDEVVEKKEPEEDSSKKKKEKPKKVFPKFTISPDVVSGYMIDFFGEDVLGGVDAPIDITLKFKAGHLNKGPLSYDPNTASYLIEINSASENAMSLGISPYLYDLVKAVKKHDNNNIEIEEQVLFTKSKQYVDEDGKLIDKFDCEIYSDYGMTKLLDKKTAVSGSQLSSISVSDYENDASTYKHTFFKDENDEYHYLSSELVED